MTSAGCALWLCLLIILPAHFALSASRHGQTFWFGFLTGLVAWFAIFTAWPCALTLYDRSQRSMHPHRQGVPPWVIAAVWSLFLGVSIGSISLMKRFYAL